MADTTLPYDREQKGSLYARAGVAEYWFANLVDQTLEVYRDPGPSPLSRYGWGYGTVAHHGAGEGVSPLAEPQAQVAVADLLP